MIKIAICEDEEIHRNILKDYLEIILKYLDTNYKILEFSSGEDLLENYPEKLDLLLLDILMDKLTGMDAARKLRQFDDKVEIMFTTSLIDYMREGYEVRAYRYILKPINYEELKKHIISFIDSLIKNRENYMIIENKNELKKISIHDITYIEVVKKDMTIYTLKEVYTTRMSLNRIEKELYKYNFFRCHKSYLVNMNQIQSIRQNIVIVNNQEVPVSRHRIKELKNKLMEVLGNVLC